MLAAACSLLVVLGYHLLTRNAPPAVATIDLQAVVEAKELQFTDLVTRPGVTDVDREKAYQLVAKMGSELEAAVAQLRADCKCLILVRAAVVGASGADLTGALKQHMGIADLDTAVLRERIRHTRIAPDAAVPPSPPSPFLPPDGRASR